MLSQGRGCCGFAVSRQHVHVFPKACAFNGKFEMCFTQKHTPMAAAKAAPAIIANKTLFEVCQSSRSASVGLQKCFGLIVRNCCPQCDKCAIRAHGSLGTL